MGVKVSTQALRLLAALTALLVCGLLGAGASWGATARSSFGNPGTHSYTVPAGVTSLSVMVVGAGGGNCSPGHGGRGAAITATIPVTPGQALIVGVGGFGAPCNGTNGNSPGAGGAGGIDGGGAGGTGARGGGGAGGGGASLIATAGSGSQPFLIAGGGGGGTSSITNGAINGGDAGLAGADGTVGGSGGGAGTQSEGGAGGTPGSNAQPGSLGAFGAGGAGGNGDLTPNGTGAGGGGGGGGYFGGGGGGGSAQNGNPGGGGGGSSYVIASATNVSASLTSTFPQVIITPGASVPAPGAKLFNSKISSSHHTAKFNFKATGQHTGFQCALVKQTKHTAKASFSSCHSPKLYKHLKKGKYTFEVRAVNAGVHGTPAMKRFTIS